MRASGVAQAPSPVQQHRPVSAPEPSPVLTGPVAIGLDHNQKMSEQQQQQWEEESLERASSWGCLSHQEGSLDASGGPGPAPPLAQSTSARQLLREEGWAGLQRLVRAQGCVMEVSRFRRGLRPVAWVPCTVLLPLAHWVAQCWDLRRSCNGLAAACAFLVAGVLGLGRRCMGPRAVGACFFPMANLMMPQLSLDRDLMTAQTSLG